MYLLHDSVSSSVCSSICSSISYCVYNVHVCLDKSDKGPQDADAVPVT